MTHHNHHHHQRRRVRSPPPPPLPPSSPFDRVYAWNNNVEAALYRFEVAKSAAKSAAKAAAISATKSAAKSSRRVNFAPSSASSLSSFSPPSPRPLRNRVKRSLLRHYRAETETSGLWYLLKGSALRLLARATGAQAEIDEDAKRAWRERVECDEDSEQSEEDYNLCQRAWRERGEREEDGEHREQGYDLYQHPRTDGPCAVSEPVPVSVEEMARRRARWRTEEEDLPTVPDDLPLPRPLLERPPFAPRQEDDDDEGAGDSPWHQHRQQQQQPETWRQHWPLQQPVNHRSPSPGHRSAWSTRRHKGKRSRSVRRLPTIVESQQRFPL